MICIYEANETDWRGNGLCILLPSSCTLSNCTLSNHWAPGTPAMS